MRELRLEREVYRREMARQTARPIYNPFYMLVHATQPNNIVQHMALPDQTDGAVLCQNTDGSFTFMLGFSELDGPDTLA